MPKNNPKILSLAERVAGRIAQEAYYDGGESGPEFSDFSEEKVVVILQEEYSSTRVQQLEGVLREILGNFQTRKTVEEFMADAGLGFRPALFGKNHGVGPQPKDSDLIRWLDVLEQVETCTMCMGDRNSPKETYGDADRLHLCTSKFHAGGEHGKK